MFYKKFFAFTLAEVLITVGIIGIVAAITMPALLQNYQKNMYVNQLKKSLNIVANGFKLATGNSEVDALGDSDLYKFSDADEFKNNLKKYFNVVKIEGPIGSYFTKSQNCKKLNGEACSYIVPPSAYKTYLNDGSVIFFDTYLPTNDRVLVGFDVNGDKQPNQAGRDIFVFNFFGNGKFYANNDSCGLQKSSSGCSDYLLKNNFNMDY